MLTIEFAETAYVIAEDRRFVIGRNAEDLAIDEDNEFLHRRFLEVRFEGGLWWLSNIGSQLAATVSDRQSGFNGWLPPAGRLPIVFAETTVRFTGGSCTYELVITFDEAPYSDEEAEPSGDGATTIGRVALTRDQRLVILALAEASLRRGAVSTAQLPSSSSAARSLGWTQKQFEKKIDNICEKLANKGVRGLKGEQGNLASTRRARLVEYALASRMVTEADLVELATTREVQSPQT